MANTVAAHANDVSVHAAHCLRRCSLQISTRGDQRCDCKVLGSITCECDILPKHLCTVIDSKLCGRVECTDGVRHGAADARHKILFAVVGSCELMAACEDTFRGHTTVALLTERSRVWASFALTG